MRWQLPDTSPIRAAPPAKGGPGLLLDGQLKRLLSLPRFSRWTITARIIAIVLTLAVPLNLVIVAAVWHLSKAADMEQRMSLLYGSRSVAAAIDAKLGQYIALAQALARSPALLEDNLAAFGAEAHRTFASIPEAWVLVADASGQQLLNLAVEPGEVLPPRYPGAAGARERAFETHAIIVTDVLRGPIVSDWIVSIVVPVFKEGLPFRALIICVRTGLFSRLLSDMQLPQNWLACIIDSQGRFIARVPGHEQSAGQLAPEGFRSVKDQEGLFEFLSVEGEPIVAANSHSAASGWPIAIAVKKAAIKQAAWSTIRWAALLGGSLSFLSLFFAGVIARRITQPIAELRHRADAILADHAPSMPQGPPEIADLWQALKQSAAERNRAAAALSESEARLRLALDGANLGTWRWEVGKGSAEMQWDTRTKALFGLQPAASITYGVWGNSIPPEDRIRAEANVARAIDPADPCDETLCEYRVEHPDGTVRWLSSNGRACFEKDPAAASGRRVTFMAGVIQDVTEAHVAAAALKESEERLRLANEAAGIGTFAADLEADSVSYSPELAAILGLPKGKTVRIADAFARLHPEDVAAAWAKFQAGLGGANGGRIKGDLRFLRPGGEVRWIAWTGRVAFREGPKGRISFGVAGACLDITERKQHEGQIKLLLAEVNHRAKNMLTVVQSIARQTAAASSEEFIERFSERIQALSASQDLLVKNEWRGVDLGELVRSQLAHFKDLIGTRIEVKGWPVLISAAAAQTIGMALHELATNAGKYGALSTGAGRVEVAWSLDGTEAGKEIFTMSWRETGGPPVTVPEKNGFGSAIIGDLAEISLSAKVGLDFQPGGLSWHLRCLAQEVLESTKAASWRS